MIHVGDIHRGEAQSSTRQEMLKTGNGAGRWCWSATGRNARIPAGD